ncbi:unnamed protein product [Musa acuminata subsp. malaccensis]|uniref:(wild Malaysian banana) hypothetical protein n=1 Tax=Musa acuminata subsp. malaccensis TaxID=214687 RepID=A0A804J2R7_MUSAM|nr:unnamed protein product [Musa acuminata subsp. malaccensis]
MHACIKKRIEPRDLRLDSQNGVDPAVARRTTPSSSFSSVVREVMVGTSMQKYLCSALEPLLRRVVREEVDRRLTHHLGQLPRSPQLQTPSLQLIFTSPLSLPIFTRGKIKDKDDNPLQIQLVRCQSGPSSIISIEPPPRVEIVVLDGDFPFNDDDNWTPKEFSSHVLRERKGKRPLLVGECRVTLRQGMASIQKLEFTDNSSWIRSRNFRLGARVSPGSYEGVRIKEAITERFTVLDHRGELNKKHFPPSRHDKVWRLKNIAKNGKFDARLAFAGITTVQDFLKLSVANQQRLRQILGQGMSEHMWNETITHASTCNIGDELYLYHGEFGTVVFNPICQVWGVMVNGLTYALEQLTPQHAIDLQMLIQNAYQNWNQLEEIDGASLIRATEAQPSSSVMIPDELHGIEASPSTVPMEMGL